MKCSKREPKRDWTSRPCLLGLLLSCTFFNWAVGLHQKHWDLSRAVTEGSAAAPPAEQLCWKLLLGLNWLGSCQIKSPAPTPSALALLLLSLKPALCKYFRMGKIQVLLAKSSGFKVLSYFLFLLRSDSFCNLCLPHRLNDQTPDLDPCSCSFLYFTVILCQEEAERQGKQGTLERWFPHITCFSPSLISISTRVNSPQGRAGIPLGMCKELCRGGEKAPARKTFSRESSSVVPGLSLCLVELPLLCQDTELQTLGESGSTPQCYLGSAIKEQLPVGDTQGCCLTKNKDFFFPLPDISFLCLFICGLIWHVHLHHAVIKC